MRPSRIAILVIIAVALSGCIGRASIGPPVEPTPTPSDDPAMNSIQLPSLSAADACKLLTTTEAVQLLGHPLDGAPAGISDPGDHVICEYRILTGEVVGDYIKLEINKIGFDGLAAQVNQHRGAHTLEVGGYQAIGADAETDPVDSEAVLSVKLARNNADPALWIEAPTSAIAKSAADLILPRLAQQTQAEQTHAQQTQARQARAKRT